VFVSYTAQAKSMICTGTSAISLSTGQVAMGNSKYVIADDGTGAIQFFDNDTLTGTGFAKTTGTDIQMTMTTTAGSTITAKLAKADERGTGKNAMLVGSKTNADGVSQIYAILKCE
jgi:hypothetical protein